MTATEQDIYSTPAILRQTLARVDERGDVLAPCLQGPTVFLGCGSSYCIALAAAALYEDARGVPEQGVIQTRFISAATLTLRLLIGGEPARAALRDLPDRIERVLGALDPVPLLSFGHVVFLGRSWRYG